MGSYELLTRHDTSRYTPCAKGLRCISPIGKSSALHLRLDAGRFGEMRDWEDEADWSGRRRRTGRDPLRAERLVKLLIDLGCSLQQYMDGIIRWTVSTTYKASIHKWPKSLGRNCNGNAWQDDLILMTVNRRNVCAYALKRMIQRSSSVASTASNSPTSF